ncbi:MAG: murein L,D-transpeptidase catalytic domain family protein [Ferruginibacter sp.]
MYSLIRASLAVITITVLIAFTPAITAEKKSTVHTVITGTEEKSVNTAVAKYNTWQLEQAGISFEAFSNAVKGYSNLTKNHRLNNKDIITIIDFTKASTEKRLFIIDMNSGAILYKTLVAHGRNSGQLFAKSFSNTESSYESSLGFYITSSTYDGKHGYSLKLNGCEKGINSNAEKRAIVVHGADYVSELFIQQNGFLGRSHGCPALPEALSKEIIDVIKNGSCLFIYAPVKKYLKQSVLLKS